MIATAQVEPMTLTDSIAAAGLELRNWQSEQDFAAMLGVVTASRRSDGLEEARSVEEYTQMYAQFKNLDRYRDIFLLEHGGVPVGVVVTRWWDQLVGIYSHVLTLFLVPEWRGRGVEQELLRIGELRSQRNVALHSGGKSEYMLFIYDSEAWLLTVADEFGYRAERYFNEMVCQDLFKLPSAELPPGIEVRPVKPEHYHQIWEANLEAFKEHWGEQKHDESDFARWLKQPYFDPSLWQIAWDGDQVVGMVLNFVDENANRQYNRKRGWTEDIAVRQAWRGRGIAQALLVRSMKMFRDMGFDSTALGVDIDNATGALRLYEKVGYVTERRVGAFHKPIDK